MKAHFDTREFVQAHNRPPRGRGGWIFQSDDRTVEAQASGTYAGARSAVARQNPQVDVWVVLP